MSVRIDPRTGELASADTPDAIFEIFPADRVPTRPAEASASGEGGGAPGGVTERLF